MSGGACFPTWLSLACSVLPAVHREPAESWHTFTGSAFHPLSEVPEQQLQAPAGATPQVRRQAAQGDQQRACNSPAAAVWLSSFFGAAIARSSSCTHLPSRAAIDMHMQSMTTAACVLVSRDSGASWTPAGDIEDAKTWLVNPTLEQGSKGQLIALFRTSTGKTYSSSSTDQGKTWSRPAGNALPNPNSPLATVTIDGQVGLAGSRWRGARGPVPWTVAGWQQSWQSAVH